VTDKEYTLEDTDSDKREEWTVQQSKKVRRKERVMISNERKGIPTNGGRKERSRRIRNRPEAIVVEVGEEKEWLQVYKEVMAAKEVMKESAGVRRTRNGDILMEPKGNSF
jgi:hypothetical protein